jgi:hypothetical protein
VETNSGAYQLFDTQAQLIAGFIDDEQRGLPSARRFAEIIRTDQPDLSGGLKFVDSPRHTGYADSGAFVKHLAKIAAQMGWRTHGLEPSAQPVAGLAVAS